MPATGIVLPSVAPAIVDSRGKFRGSVKPHVYVKRSGYSHDINLVALTPAGEIVEVTPYSRMDNPEHYDWLNQYENTQQASAAWELARGHSVERYTAGDIYGWDLDQINGWEEMGW